ncbi:glycosyl hydrolase family 18 protein [Streptomyces orinoci]|uniref:Glycosyl hydrolase family 18 protein n=1 Tax=Streptomyces orinoci TaxID=67339 RepID=A0ABV3K537_STRON|nr:glycosyl hydrolase family 18 protein [Streptomyces orinoci]
MRSLVLLIALSLTTCLLTAGTARTAPAATRTTSAWLPYWGTKAAYDDALRHADQLHTVSPFWYEASSATTITGYSGAGDRQIIDGLHGKGVKVVPTVVETPDAPAMAALLGDPAQRSRHTDALLRIAESGAYQGLDLDYERMTETKDPGLLERVRTGYNALMGDLCKRLHARHQQCVVTVMPQISGRPLVYDYPYLGKVADHLRIMGYNLHNALAQPGPLSSVTWYEQFLRYAVGTVPREKLEVALPAYGWDWTVGSNTRASHVTCLEAETLRRTKGVPYEFDAASATPHFAYPDAAGHRHEVWYQDARGTAAHLAVLHKWGVRGTGLWALGFEEAGLWDVLRG